MEQYILKSQSMCSAIADLDISEYYNSEKNKEDLFSTIDAWVKDMTKGQFSISNKGEIICTTEGCYTVEYTNNHVVIHEKKSIYYITSI